MNRPSRRHMYMDIALIHCNHSAFRICSSAVDFNVDCH